MNNLNVFKAKTYFSARVLANAATLEQALVACKVFYKDTVFTDSITIYKNGDVYAYVTRLNLDSAEFALDL